jgi:outer membrane protein assembly factor BamD (BamD/ComL family)
MKRCVKCLGLAALLVVAFPFRSPAPFVYRPGIGWVYEAVGSVGTWIRFKAKDQLDVAQEAFDKKDYDTASKAAQWLVKNWPRSDYAPQGEYLLARCREESKYDELAFKNYQALLEKYPKAANYEEVLRRQFEICNRFLDGERFKIFGVIPGFSSMDKTVAMYEKVIKNGPYSDIAPQAQLNIGAAREKQTGFLNDQDPWVQAARAYELAADRYHDRPKLAAEAEFREGRAYQKQARTAEYDQATAGKAIDTFTDFIATYPDDPRVKEAENAIASLKREQARGSFETAKFYERIKEWKGAIMYYSDAVSKSPDSPYKDVALQRIAALQKLSQPPAGK